MASASIPESYYDLNDSDNTCFLCNHPKYSLLYDVAHYEFPFRFQKCQCGIIKQTPMPNEEFFNWFFNADEFFDAKKSEKGNIWGYQDYFSDEPSRLATSAARYKKLKTYFQSDKPLHIIKIGPGSGTFLYEANKHGHHAIGCDVSDRFRQYAKNTYGVEVDHGRFEKMDYQENQFDVVVLFNVIENVPNQAEFLSAIHRTLKPGGYFIFNFVDMHHNVISAIQKSHYFIFRPPICYAYDMKVINQIMDKFHFKFCETKLDIRHMTLEKIFTLLGYKGLWSIARALHIERIPFPIYAYPSKIVISQKI